MAKRKKRKAPDKVPVVYDDGVTNVEYVGKQKNELRPELERIVYEIKQVLRILQRLRRHRHIIIISARFQLVEALRDLPEELETEEDVANEIARLSFTMEDTLKLLGRLSNSRIPVLEAARFKLTYGQTPKRREPAGAFRSKKNKKDD